MPDLHPPLNILPGCLNLLALHSSSYDHFGVVLVLFYSNGIVPNHMVTFFSSFSNVDFVIFVIIDISISRVYLFFVYMYY